MKEDGRLLRVTAKRRGSITAAAVLFLLFGLGSAVADPLILAYIIYYRSAPIFPLIGNVMDGSTPIGVLGGLNAVIGLGFVLVAVAVLEVVAGIWLWKSRKKGGKLGVALAPLDLFFAVGFGIPILYVLAPLRTLLLVLGWESLR